MKGHQVFITGGTGYIGRAVIPALLDREHHITALVRKGSEHKLPTGCTPVIGDPLDASTYVQSVVPADTFIHLVGVALPAKAASFRSIDYASAKVAATVAAQTGVQHFIYLSVAQPAPVMKDYIQARSDAEAAIRENGLNATFLRPWYVLGPNHRWPYLLMPMYWLFELLPFTREGAQRLGLVTLQQMVAALVTSVEVPSHGVRIFDVPAIRNYRIPL